MPEILAVLCIGVATYLMRYALIGLSGRYTLPPGAQRALRYVPPAVLTALIVAGVGLYVGSADLSLANARLYAGAVAVVVAWRTRNVFMTLAVGMGTLWLLLWLTHAP